jgi:GT2 family glycosyltransferase
MTARPAVSIVVVTHNAPRYIARLFWSLRRTRAIDYRVVVVDNRSRWPTRLLLIALSLAGRIGRLCLLDQNTLFSEANNIGVAASAREATLALLLNSDVEIRDPLWLADLVDLHRRGATAYGFVDGPPVPRADGYCLLVDRDLYERHGLDEDFAWWWSVTRLQAQILGEGHAVQAVAEHDDRLVHFGGGSGEAWRGASGMDIDPSEVAAWFDGRSVQRI